MYSHHLYLHAPAIPAALPLFLTLAPPPSQHLCPFLFLLVFCGCLLLSPMPRCVFLPDNGAFFVNYVITAALLGTGMDLLRLGSLCLYSIRLFFSRSEPERVHIRKVRVRPFSKHSPQSCPWEGVRKGACWKHQAWEAR